MFKIQHKTLKPLINEGDRCKLNYKKITSSPDFKRRNSKYQQFILENKDTVFKTVFESETRRKQKLFSLIDAENPLTSTYWLFHSFDLIKVK